MWKIYMSMIIAALVNLRCGVEEFHPPTTAFRTIHSVLTIEVNVYYLDTVYRDESQDSYGLSLLLPCHDHDHIIQHDAYRRR
jgi:hypothetical protein